ncbi:MAG: hypothetical protein CVV02_16195 [Firmicutes bacterium HGW-Firmicutes-7]|nr:MAG: hypothetical protein CVV02_16195 [Firmicutes bacterium HGW-Firmicutes-7]
MKVIFLRIKFLFFIIGVLVLIFSALLLITVIIKQQAWDDRLLITPKAYNAVSVDVEMLEELNETKYMLTYEVNEQQNVKAIHSSHTVILKGTNYTYPFVMNYSMSEGGYFTKDVVEQNSKYVVINELSAFDIFGGTNIIGNEIIINQAAYRIIGVIKDGDDDNKNVYLPVTFFADDPDTFIVKMEADNEMSDEFIQNAFKHIGITTSNYNFVNIAKVYAMIREKVLVCLGLIVAIILYLIMRRAIAILFDQYNNINKLLKVFYFTELFLKNIRVILTIIAAGIVLVSSSGGLILLFMKGVKSFLKWREVDDIMQFDIPNNYNNILQLLKNMTIYSDVLFLLFVFMISILIFQLTPILYKTGRE